MKVLGLFSFIFGLGLLGLAGYGGMQELQHTTLAGSLIALALLFAGVSIVFFVIRTFSRTTIVVPAGNDELLDLPDHIAEDEKQHSITPFIMSCGYVSLISSLIMILYSAYAAYTFISIAATFGGEAWSWLLLIMGLIFAGAVMLLIYCIRKLFFSRR